MKLFALDRAARLLAYASGVAQGSAIQVEWRRTVENAFASIRQLRPHPCVFSIRANRFPLSPRLPVSDQCEAAATNGGGPVRQSEEHYPLMHTALRTASYRLRVLITLGVVVLAAAVIIACGSATTTTLSSSSSGSSSKSTTGSSTSSKPQGPAKVGDTITINNVAGTLVSVNTLQGDDFTQPKAGNQFIVVHVKLVNKSSSEFDYNEFDFHAKSGAGNITDAEVPPSTYTANNELNSGKLAAGGNVEGDIVFQVPLGDHAAQVTWQPSIFGSASDNAWNLGL